MTPVRKNGIGHPAAQASEPAGGSRLGPKIVLGGLQSLICKEGTMGLCGGLLARSERQIKSPAFSQASH